MKFLTLIVLLFALPSYAQQANVFHIDSLPTEGVLLDKGWKFHAGDNPDWAKPNFDDSAWESIDPTKDVMDLPQIQDGKIGWIRLRIKIDTNLLPQSFGLRVLQTIASEIYVNGHVIKRYGHLNAEDSKATYVRNIISFPQNNTEISIAVRFALQKLPIYNKYASLGNNFFNAKLVSFNTINISAWAWNWVEYSSIAFISGGIFLILFILHLAFYIYYPPQKANLYFSAMAFCYALHSFMWALYVVSPVIENMEGLMVMGILRALIFPFIYIFLLKALYSIFNLKLDFIYWSAFIINISMLFAYFFNYKSGVLVLETTIIQLNTLISIYITIKAFFAHIKNTKIILLGMICSVICFGIRALDVWYIIPHSLLTDVFMPFIATISIPISISWFLGAEFAVTNKRLLEKLIEVKQLAGEKQQILATQNETLEKQVQERTAELQEKNLDLEVEAALERVRSKTMAMRSSDDVTTAIATLFTELEKLGVNNLRCGIVNIHANKTMGVWSVNNVENLKSAKGAGIFDMNAHIMWQHLYESWAKKEEFFYYFLTDKEKEDYVKVLNAKPNYLPQAVQQFPDMSFQAYSYDEGSIWAFSLEPHSETDKLLMQRFTSVFSLTFQRYQDLQKAEAQTREAQIEVALERVRSKTLSMQSSNELSTIIGLIYQEMGKLNVQFYKCFFMVFNPQNLGVTWWMASGESLDLGQGYFVQYSEHPPQMAYLKGWQERQETWRYLMQGEEKALWDAFLFHETELVQLPPFIIDNMKSYKTVHLDASFNSFGCLTTGDEQPLNDEAFDLLIRFSKVFDFAYTRFKDLEQKEKLAKQAQEDLIQLKEEKSKTDQAITELRATQAQLIQKEKLASLGELTAGIAHEIQNPLNFVNNFSELSVDLVKDLKTEMSKPSIDKEYIDELFGDLTSNQEKINHHGKRASSIVKGMLEHSRASTGVKELTDINKLADEYLRLSYHGLRAKDTTFNADFELIADPNLPKIEVIPQDIGRVLLNLINNAFYAVNERKQAPRPPEGEQNNKLPLWGSGGYTPSVFVSTHYVAPPLGAGGQIIIKVKDNGTGMPESVRAKVFQPFFTTKPTGQGTGLGLSLAYDIVTKGHAGVLEVESEEGVGTTFIVKLLTK